MTITTDIKKADIVISIVGKQRTGKTTIKKNIIPVINLLDFNTKVFIEEINIEDKNNDRGTDFLLSY